MATKGFIPTFEIYKGSENITARFQDRAVSITVTLASGRGEQDACDIILDDREWKIATPRKGDRLQVYLGYEGIGTTFMGNFEVNSINFSFVPKAITVRCTAASSLNDLKSTVIAAHDDKTVEQILAEAGQKIGFKADVHSSIADNKVPFLNQSMSFGALIGRLEQHYDAVAKINDGNVSLTPRAGGFSVSGFSLPTYVLGPEAFADLNVMVDAASEYAQTSASYMDKTTKKIVWLDEKSKLSDLSTDAKFKIGQQFNSEGEARKAAESTQAQLDRATGKISGRFSEGDPWCRDGQRIVVTNTRDGIDGSYLLDVVVHSYTKSGALTTSFSGTAGVNGLAEEYQEGNNSSEFVVLPPGMVFGQVLPAPKNTLENPFNSVPSMVGQPAPILE
ncbi:hypothetical protein [Methylobacterium sp. WL19]|uniref:phage late control D family protein n=1 Tax=Methylobacterium sp. WL19 TaxID=2603896 RepID=UPI0011CC8625|nr:hypothetical protein [Methylobacterium sp. WL19]TXN27401.1 hypothetical protein FV220_11605 [Methylobacterium sp. WL19]